MMNAMRLNHGVQKQFFTERTGISVAAIQHALDKLQKLGFMEQENNHLMPTEKGHQFLNNILEIFDDEGA